MIANLQYGTPIIFTSLEPQTCIVALLPFLPTNAWFIDKVHPSCLSDIFIVCREREISSFLLPFVFFLVKKAFFIFLQCGNRVILVLGMDGVSFGGLLFG